jgi:uncharacterized protein (DUF2141 family)
VRQGAVIRGVCLAAIAAPLIGATMPEPIAVQNAVVVEIDGLRSAHGQVLACLTADPRSFPDCQKDPHALHLTAPAINGEAVQFKGVQPGRYAIALFHDENANGRMDKTFMLPREGFGFSRDAPIQFGPPRFGAASFAVGTVQLRTAIHMRYLL